ncbi:MAG: terminase [Citromicrobium sp.]|nr:terminase [Citromicrobium sp.]|tara:strand:- start:9645 stop:10148 length:504 start_codon:yes stop_codon:yes gene_type:complete
MNEGLTPKQQRFVEEYPTDCNGKQAAIRAGYSAPTAEVTASRLLSNVKVKAAIDERLAALAEKAGVTQERIVEEFVRMGFYDPADLVRTPVTKPEDIANLPEDVRRAIVGWSWDKAGNFTLKLADKAGSLVSLGRHLGMFKDRVEHDVGQDLAAAIQAGNARASQAE